MATATATATATESRAFAFRQPLTGATLFMDRQDSRALRLAQEPNFNDTSVLLWQALLQMHQWDVVVDVGANYGEMTMAVPKRTAARVVSYEANPTVAEFLRATVALGKRDVEVRELAVSDAVGSVRFSVDDDWSGTSGIAEHLNSRVGARQHEISVPATTIDADFADLPAGDSMLLKIDVEGAEEAVLAGAAATLAPDRVWAAMIEVLHMGPEQLALLTQTWPVLFADLRTRTFVRIAHLTPRAARALLAGSWLHLQDAVLVSPAFLNRGVSR